MSSYYGNFYTTRYLCCSRVCSRRTNTFTTLLRKVLHLLQCYSAVCRLEKGERNKPSQMVVIKDGLGILK